MSEKPTAESANPEEKTSLFGKAVNFVMSDTFAFGVAAIAGVASLGNPLIAGAFYAGAKAFQTVVNTVINSGSIKNTLLNKKTLGTIGAVAMVGALVGGPALLLAVGGVAATVAVGAGVVKGAKFAIKKIGQLISKSKTSAKSETQQGLDINPPELNTPAQSQSQEISAPSERAALDNPSLSTPPQVDKPAQSQSQEASTLSQRAEIDNLSIFSPLAQIEDKIIVALPATPSVQAADKTKEMASIATPEKPKAREIPEYLKKTSLAMGQRSAAATKLVESVRRKSPAVKVPSSLSPSSTPALGAGQAKSSAISS